MPVAVRSISILRFRPATDQRFRAIVMALVQQSPEVFLAEGPIGTIGAEDIEVLRQAVRKTPKRRVRINAHPGSDDELHEMIIAIEPGSYIRPHKHPGKSEAFHII